MRGLKKTLLVALVGLMFSCCMPNCCDIDLPNLGKCFKAQPCELLLLLLGGLVPGTSA